MKTQIIQIGNSQGIRIPKVLLEETRISGEVELIRTADGILIKPSRQPRDGWDAEFARMTENDDDEVLFTAGATDFEKKGWKW